MEIGRIPEIDQAQANQVEKVQTVKELNDNQKVIQDDQYKNVQGNPQEIETNEVILDNVKFGYNKNSQDFFVKITRGETEYKYPTEDMMRVKAHLLSEVNGVSK